MTMKLNVRCSVAAFALFITVCLPAQTDDFKKFMHNIHSFNRLYPQEKVWLHCDNTAYFQGDTIWFAAYVTSAETLQPANDLSKVLYVELLNEVGEVVSTQRLQIENGRCHGQIPLNTELERKVISDRIKSYYYPINRQNGNYCIPLPAGYYEVRAYTRAMLNWGADVCFSRVFPVFDTPEYEGDYSQLTMNNQGRAKDRIRPKSKKEERLNVDFYPEGGNIVSGLPCRVAYKVTDREGRNLNAHCLLLADGEVITDTETKHDGMGAFFFFPREGVKYKLRVNTEQRDRTFYLPEAKQQGFMLTADATKEDSVYISIAATDSLQNKAIGMSITSRGKMLHFNVYDGIPKRPIQLPAIAKNSLSPGVNQVTLFDADGQVYAERLFFVHDTAVVGKSPVEYRLDKEEYKPFEKINLVLQSRRGGPMCPPEKDVVADSGRHIGQPLQVASLSVRDGSTEIRTPYTDNLQTYLLLTSDLKGYIHRPDYYFEADDSVHRTALDLLMMTQGWRRYAWKQLAGVEKIETPHFIEEGLTLHGQVKHHKKKEKFLKGINVGAIISDGKIVEQSGYNVTDLNGCFSFKIKPFVGRKRLSLNITDKQKNTIDGKILLHRHFSPQPRQYQFIEKDILFSPRQYKAETDSFSFSGVNAIGSIEVKRKNRKFEPFILHNIIEEREKALDTDDKYFMSYRIGSYFYDRYDVSENEDEILWAFYQDDDSEYQSSIREWELGVGLRIRDIMIRYVDYILVYTNDLAHKRIGWMKASDRERAEKINSATTVISWIYKKPKAMTGLRTTHIDGYSEVIDYYHPQYNREIIPGEVDYRRTLYWNPCVELNEEGKANVMFYNNSTCKRPVINFNY